MGLLSTSVGVIGTGCPPGSAYVLVSGKSGSVTRFQERASEKTTVDDATALTAVYSELNALAGPGVSISSNRKNCQLTLGVRSGFLSSNSLDSC